MTLISGQGAAMAMGGAYLLAQALRQHPDYVRAFEQYENTLRPAKEQRQKNARDFAKSFVPGSTLGVFWEMVFMQVVLRNAFVGFLRKQFGAESILPAEEAT